MRKIKRKVYDVCFVMEYRYDDFLEASGHSCVVKCEVCFVMKMRVTC